MTAATLATITCDHPGCGARWPGTAATAELARQVASEQRWRRVAGRDYCPRHAYVVPAAPAVQPRSRCDPMTMEDCSSCGEQMHRGAARVCLDGHPVHGAEGVCCRCRRAVLRDPAAPRRPQAKKRRRDQLLDDWVDLSSTGVGFAEFARYRDMKYGTWEQAFRRARNAGDPRARRFDQGETAA